MLQLFSPGAVPCRHIGRVAVCHALQPGHVQGQIQVEPGVISQLLLSFSHKPHDGIWYEGRQLRVVEICPLRIITCAAIRVSEAN